jgi:hypothetical protein
VPMLCYGDMDQDRRVTQPQDRGKETLHLKDVAVCTDFNTNSASFDQLQGRGYCWNNKRENNFLDRAWPEKALGDSVGQSCARWRSAMDNRLSTMSCQEASIRHLSQIAYYVARSRITSRDPRPGPNLEMRNHNIYVRTCWAHESSSVKSKYPGGQVQRQQNINTTA